MVAHMVSSVAVVLVVRRVRVHGLSLHEKVVYHRGRKQVDMELVDRQVDRQVVLGSFDKELLAVVCFVVVADTVVPVLDSTALVVVAVMTVVVFALAGPSSPRSFAAAFQRAVVVKSHFVPQWQTCAG